MLSRRDRIGRLKLRNSEKKVHNFPLRMLAFYWRRLHEGAKRRSVSPKSVSFRSTAERLHSPAWGRGAHPRLR